MRVLCGCYASAMKHMFSFPPKSCRFLRFNKLIPTFNIFFPSYITLSNFVLCKVFSAFSANCVSFAVNCIIVISQKSSTFAVAKQNCAINKNYISYAKL